MEFSAGYTTVQVATDTLYASFPMGVMYPTRTPEQPEKLGKYTLDVALNATPAGGPFPLVIISHGSGGSHLVYRTLARFLARHGFVVGMPEHTHNNLRDNRLEGTVQNLINRPQQIQAAIDLFYEHPYSKILKPDSVAVIGHSLGGYTALSIAGGVATSLPHEAPDGQPTQIEVTPDKRVKALVLLAPATVWYREQGALNEVDLPVLMFCGEKDQYTPPQYHARLVLDGVPDPAKVQYHLVENGGHFSFLSPFPEEMKSATFPPSQDPPGFNRERFHDEMNGKILEFLRRDL